MGTISKVCYLKCIYQKSGIIDTYITLMIILQGNSSFLISWKTLLQYFINSKFRVIHIFYCHEI